MSVIIASYRWPEALRLSLASALEQTVEDIEVLVIEDGPDRASRRVVRKAKDDRVEWLQLPTSTGSQSGPNSRGIELARAPVIAYLGHDDIWHRDHLSALLDVLSPDVDVAHGITLLLRAGEELPIGIAGSDGWEPATFVPPSSLAHWRDNPRIGVWPAPDESGMPVDHAFLMSCGERGARFAGSGAPTVFKHPAALHVDSYRTRDVRAQVRLRKRLRQEPDMGDRLLRDALAAGVPRNTPAAPQFPPGVIADHNRRMKGLEARFGPRVSVWRPDASFRFPGWYLPEENDDGHFAWTGTAERAMVRLDAPDGRELGVRLLVRIALVPEQLDQLVVDVDGTRLALSRTNGPGAAIQLSGWLGRRAHQSTVEVGLSTKLVQPCDVDPHSTDDRPLGLALAEIELLGRG